MANLEKVIYINEIDYSTLVNGGSITKSGVTYTYDETALYVIKDVGAPEYAETAGYATSAGTATKATQDGGGNVITETYATKASGASEILYTDANSSEYNVAIGDTLNEVITALDDAIGEFHVTVDSALSETSENAISNKAITQALYEDEEVISASLNDLNERMEEKQDLLVSGSNIKTINNQSLLGSGNINISGGGGDVNVIEIVKVNGTALTPDANKAVNVVVPTALSALSTDTTHQLVTSSEKTNWNSHTGNTEVHVTANDKSTWSGKQDALVSGTNIKTINTNSLLGSGDITIPTGETNVIETIKINGTAQTVTNKTVDLAIPMPDSGMSTTSENPVQNKVVTQTILDNELVTSTALNELNARVDDKQDELVSGINLKTINNNSLLGSGNLTISTGETNVIETVKVNGTALTPDSNKAVNITSVPGSIVTQDATHRFVSDTEKSTWTNKQDSLEHYSENNGVNISSSLYDGGNIDIVYRDDDTTLPISEIILNTNGIELNANQMSTGGGDEIEHTVTLNYTGFKFDNKQIATTDQIPSNVIGTVKVNGTALTPDANKAVDVTVPTALSALSDDSTHQLVTSTEKSNWNSHTGNTEVHVTASDKTNWNTHTANTSIHVTSTDKTNWDGKVSKTGDTMTGNLTISNADLSVTGTTRLTYNNATALAVGSTGVCATGLTQISGNTTIKGDLMTSGKTEFRYSGDTILALGSTGVCVTGRTYVSGDTEFKGGVSVIYSGNTALSVNGNASFTGQTKLHSGSNGFEFNSGDTAVKITGNTTTTGQTKLYSSGNTLLVTGGTQINGGLTASTFSGNSVTAERIYRYGHTNIKEILFSDGESSANITLSQLPTVTAADNGKILMVVNGAWALVSPTTIYTGTGTPSSSQGNNGDIYLQTT